MKRTRSLAATLACAALALAACGSDDSDGGTDSSSESYNVAVTQIVTHDSLDQSIAGFKQALEDEGLDVTYDDQNANNDQTVVASIAGTLASSDTDLALGVGTPMAQGLAQSIADKPILFTAVTDPVDAGLVESLEAPGANVTGTTDANPVEEQLDLIVEIDPDVARVGVVYNSGEANSAVQVQWLKDAAAERDIEVVESTVSNTAEVQQAANSLGVDAIYVPTDNTVISAFDSVVQVGESKGIPVYPAEGDSVAKGGLATYGLNYFDLGYQTGEMAVKILVDGEDPATMAVETQNEPVLYLNLGAAERMGVDIPQDVLDRADEENITE
ncbi:MAG: ABC transporter substrate-binding protein [Ancrocorticia sp.]|uniref:ABC transporter substrate-binding protein n=1 Tax=Ancrocorticia sp. TaxID=2593684 RepID=UPI003F92CA36